MSQGSIDCREKILSKWSRLVRMAKHVRKLQRLFSVSAQLLKNFGPEIRKNLKILDGKEADD